MQRSMIGQDHCKLAVLHIAAIPRKEMGAFLVEGLQ